MTPTSATTARRSEPDASGLHTVSLTVNGVPRTLALEPRQMLLDVLRDELGLCGTKRVCTMGNCGACTVHLDGRAVYSCLVLGVECGGCEIATVESLAEGDELHPVQQAFLDNDAYQCGFCTPGQIMSLAALLDGETVTIDDAAIVRATSGNLCRCGAYRNILKAGRQAAGETARKSTRDVEDGSAANAGGR